MKIVKRILIGIGIFVLSIILILLVTPLLFKNQLMTLAKTELNKMLTAEVDFSDLKLSFIRNFPNAYIALEDVSVTGKDDFEGVKLAGFKRFSVTVDIVSVIKMDNIQVKSILLDQLEANARILEDGRANWDIMPASETVQTVQEEIPSETTGEAAPASDALTFNVALKKLEIKNASLSFTDDSSKMKATVDDLNLLLQGDMAKEIVDLNLKLQIDGINFWLDGIRMLTDAQVGFTSVIGADLKNMGFTLKENRFNLNEFILKFAGNVHLPDDAIALDLSFATEETDFKSLLSLVPVIYMQDFEDLQTTGSLTLSGDAKGIIKDEIFPVANIKLTVDNAMFKYPDLPASVDDINIEINAHYDGEIFDNTTLDINRFEFKLARNPFSAKVSVKTPESDMQVEAGFNGKIDVGSVANIVPLGDMTLKGLLEVDLAIAGKMSTLEQERYEDFTADGMLKISGFDFISPDFPQAVQISSLLLNFNPRAVDLATDVVIGSSDISLNGGLSNFIPFIFAGDTVRGNLDLNSKNINLNEFMTGEPAPEQEPVPESAPLTVIEVPANIDFALNVNIGRILFDKLNITDTVGIVLVKDGKLEMQKLALNLLEGSLVLNGEYNTQNIKVPSIDFGMDIKQFDITSALSSFEVLETILPNPQNYRGKVSANLNLAGVLGQDMSPVLDTINSKGRLQTHNLELIDSPLFKTLADVTKNESYRNPSLGNLDVGFEIIDGQLIVDPFDIKVSQTTIEISGSQSLASDLDYKIKAGVPTSLIGGASDLLKRVPGGSGISELTLTGLITGTPKNPRVSLSAADMAGTVVDAAKEQITEAVTARVEEAREQISAEVQKQIDNLLAEAENQANNIRQSGKQNADKLRSEANAAADKLEREAANKNAIAKTAAKAAADKLRKEGEDSARKVEQEADRLATNTLNAARQRADELRRSGR